MHFFLSSLYFFWQPKRMINPSQWKLLFLLIQSFFHRIQFRLKFGSNVPKITEWSQYRVSMWMIRVMFYAKHVTRYEEQLFKISNYFGWNCRRYGNKRKKKARVGHRKIEFCPLNFSCNWNFALKLYGMHERIMNY